MGHRVLLKLGKKKWTDFEYLGYEVFAIISNALE